ncbi:Hypothetical protein ORPV_688 [Orpheovirus IHUMI-LCC2]|uniref:Uncharacterized protein n=1 Tax=Orpheovirus IHUMI-LCC2 TaxID=2023057 RepID=A0A2I2L4X0_9VIRU|nr:Hypothetical protein ORPV_688 [Orpheovirus IHUMI-LCC2]SNW62592.1 Hypothetical protein ORPV_688 [Orpheovirus IHUMI-LCC2]
MEIGYYGFAPGLKYRMMYENNMRIYTLLYNNGDEIMSGLYNFIYKEKIYNASFSGIGSCYSIITSYENHIRHINEQTFNINIFGTICKEDDINYSVRGILEVDGNMENILHAIVHPTFQLCVIVYD